jgi:hypothetical protein
MAWEAADSALRATKSLSGVMAAAFFLELCHFYKLDETFQQA